MTHAEAAEILSAHNSWRRGDDAKPQLPPKIIGEAIDHAILALAGLADCDV